MAKHRLFTATEHYTRLALSVLLIAVATLAGISFSPVKAHATTTVLVPPTGVLDFSSAKRTSTSNQTSVNGWAYYTNVLTEGGVQVDAKVTTYQLSNASITNYDDIGSASGNDNYFQINNSASAAGGFTKFKFEFFNHADNSVVTLQNVRITSIDLDSPGRQFTEFSNFNRYVLANPTNLAAYTTNENNVALPDGLVRFTPTRGQSVGSHSNIAADAVEADFDSLTTFYGVFGNEQQNDGYFGIAFQGLCSTVTGNCVTGTPVGSPQMTNYTITYNGNSNTGGTAPSSYTGNGNITLATNSGTLARTGYTFAGWNTAADGSGTHYNVSDTYNLAADVTLYAQWTSNVSSYTITYSGNSNTGGTAPAVTTGNGSVTLRGNTGTLARTGYTLGGWNTAADGSGTHYALSASYNLTADVTLYAEWTAVASYTITYDGNGFTGGTVPAVTTGSGNKVLRTNTGTLVYTNYTFKGWNTAADGSGTHYNVGASYFLSADVTLYAEWTPIPQVIYNGNGNTGGTKPGNVNQGGSITIDPNTGNLVRAGYRFTGWNTHANGSGTNYAGGDTPTLPVGTVLYAQWEKVGSLAGTGSEAGTLFMYGSLILGLGLFMNAVSRIRRRA